MEPDAKMIPRMANDSRAYRNTLLTLWVILSGIAYFYSKQQNIPSTVATWLAAALFVETAFYLAPGFSYTRTLVDEIEPPIVRAFILTLSALVPYAIYTLGTGTFHWRNLGLLAAIATVVTAWFVVQAGKRPIADVLFVILLVAVSLSKVFKTIYPTLAPKADASILGQLMLIRTGAFAVISIRKMGGINFGFLPSTRDWIIGILCYAAVIPVGAFANTFVHFAEPHLAPGPWWRIAGMALGTFLAILWVVALSEEFLFRGILQQLISARTGALAGLILTSLLFGAVHLPFRAFPNWRFAVMAALIGLFYGIAYMRAKSIRAAMVTHALVVTTWRVFFA